MMRPVLDSLRSLVNLLTFTVRNASGSRAEWSRLVQLVRKLGPSRVLHRLLFYVRNGTEQYDYARRIARHEQLSDAERDRLRQACETLPLRPLLSVIMPVYNPPLEWLRAAIDSVRDQWYEHWELCIADDASTDPELQEVLASYAARDSRIRYVVRQRNGHISAASNSALELARGEFIVLLDQDDVLAEQALCVVATEIARHPDCDLLYSDEDKLSPAGTRCEPFFKPDWNASQILCQNMFSHLGVYRTSLVRQLGGFRQGFEGAQDYDLTLRCVERTLPSRIRHLPQVLYHWRISATSTAANPTAKSYAFDAACRAIDEHLARQGTPAQVASLQWPGMYRVSFALPDPRPTVTTVSWSAVPHSKRRAEQRIEQQPDAATTLVEYAPLPNTVTPREQFSWSAWRQRWELSQSRITGEFVVWLESSLMTGGDAWLDNLLALGVQPNVGAVGAKLVSPHGLVAHAGYVATRPWSGIDLGRGVPSDLPGPNGHCAVLRDCAAVSGWCLLVRRASIERLFADTVGTAESRRWDLELCRRLRAAGQRIVWAPHAVLQTSKLANFDTWEQMFADSHEPLDVDSTAFLSPHHALLAPECKSSRSAS